MKLFIVVLTIGGFACLTNADPSLTGKLLRVKHKGLYYENFIRSIIPLPGYSSNETRYPNDPPFEPTPECGDSFLNLTDGSFGTITTPNYPETYNSDLQCEWIFESARGTVVETTFFDMVTQPWVLTYFDYVMVSTNGQWDQYRRFSGDMNDEMPFTFISNGTKLGVRFVSSSWINFRGFKMSFIVRPYRTSDKLPSTNEYGSAYNNDLVAMCDTTPIEIPQNSDLPIRNNTRKPKPVIKSKDSTKVKGKANVFIVNGFETNPHQYPFMVALIVDEYYFCGGSLIDDQHVLTAAHCVDLSEKIDMYFGVHNLTDDDENLYARQVRTVEFPITSTHVFMHPHYDYDSGAHDIAIVRLPEKVTLTGYVQPIYLPSIYSTGNSFTSWNLTTLGWGETRKEANHTRITPVLREAAATVIPNTDCRSTFYGSVTGNNICTQTPVVVESTPGENGEDYDEEAEVEYESPCHGDSGSPLIAEFIESPSSEHGDPNHSGPSNHRCVQSKPNGSPSQGIKSSYSSKPLTKWYVQVGVVSFGSRVCGRSSPVAYTRVNAYIEWISWITGRHG